MRARVSRWIVEIRSPLRVRRRTWVDDLTFTWSDWFEQAQPNTLTQDEHGNYYMLYAGLKEKP